MSLNTATGLFGTAVGLFVLAESVDLLKHTLHPKNNPYPRKHKILKIGKGGKSHYGYIVPGPKFSKKSNLYKINIPNLKL